MQQSRPQDREKVLATLRQNWREEVESAATYRELARLEKDERRRGILLQIAAVEERHARQWAERIIALGGENPATGGAHIGPSQAVLLAAKVGGLDSALRRVEAKELEHTKAYGDQLKTLGDPPSAELIADMLRDENSHAHTMRALSRPAVEPKSRLDTILKRERWHSRTGSWIGDAIYGVNDGLTAVFGIVSGVAAASSHEAVVIAGIAGMLSSALSMGASAYLANKSEREVFEAEMFRERREIQEHPDEEREELALFYQLKGLSEDEARLLADRLAQRPEQFLQALAQEELGLSESNLPNPAFSALVGTVSTAVGAIVPVAPFLLATGATALVASMIVSIAAHFAVGAAKSLVTNRSWWKSGLEMTGVAILVAGIAYMVGKLLSLPM